MTEPVEGWYTDLNGINQLRWWDGHTWTGYVGPYEAPASSLGDVEIAVLAVDEAFPASSPEERVVTSAGTPIPMPEASLPQEVTLTSSVAEAPVALIPMPGSPVDEEDSNETGAPEKSETLKWILACTASWVLVVVFIIALIIVWSHPGASNRIQENAKGRAEIAQNEPNTARSALGSISQQLQEATR